MMGLLMNDQNSLPKAYEPKASESLWRSFWEENQFFNVDTSSKAPPFCCVMPPPNVTGKLHMGHALVSTLQDIRMRYERMRGKNVLWIPGLDHAGISTQTIVERELIKKTGKRRVDFKRDEFLAHVWNWKEEHGKTILEQMARLGCSSDTSKLKFTLDKSCSKAVGTVFKRLFDEGLIYRGDYLVNWDPITQTALADDEVEHEERDSFLWYFSYPLENGSGSLSIATTRPETMLGDSGVAVHPDDTRYQELIGKKIRLPLTDRLIPILGDHMVDPEFGTGAVKITPAHDFNDYEVGERHHLEQINIMTPDGKINERGGPFTGLTMLKAREAIVEKMKSLGLLEKVEPHKNRIGLSYRSKAIIEPFLSKQWFINMAPFKERLIEIVEKGEVELVPKNWEKTYYHWIRNLRDWCISRQLWWGHRIPVWYHKDDPEKMICFEGEGLPPQVAAHPNEWVQDPDVLDTWFSSGLWPFSALGWPDSNLAETFYPNATLITGHDILFFWVARMILMGDYVMKKPPFKQVFLHGLIYGKSYWRENSEGGITYVSADEQRRYDMGEKPGKHVKSRWEKMSKSKGNVIDPIEVIDEYGCDAMRMALSSFPAQNKQIDLDRRRFEEFKNFANKIWNGARFAWMHLEDLEVTSGIDESLLDLEDRWILHLAHTTSGRIDSALGSYLFDAATNSAYEFFWNDFCAYFLEIAKPALFGKRGDSRSRENKQKVLLITLLMALRMIAPFAPFITEELFQKIRLKFGSIDLKTDEPFMKDALEALSSSSMCKAPFPYKIGPLFPVYFTAFEHLKEIVLTVRQIRGECKIAPGAPIDIHLQGPIDEKHLYIIETLGKGACHLHAKMPSFEFSAEGMSRDIKICVPLPEEMIEREKARLAKEKERLEAEHQQTKKRLANPEFAAKAPEHIRAKLSQRLEQIEEHLKHISLKI